MNGAERPGLPGTALHQQTECPAHPSVRPHGAPGSWTANGRPSGAAGMTASEGLARLRLAQCLGNRHVESKLSISFVRSHALWPRRCTCGMGGGDCPCWGFGQRCT